MNTQTKPAQARTPDTRADYALHQLRQHATRRIGTEQTIPRFIATDAAAHLRVFDANVARIAELEAALRETCNQLSTLRAEMRGDRRMTNERTNLISAALQQAEAALAKGAA